MLEYTELQIGQLETEKEGDYKIKVQQYKDERDKILKIQKIKYETEQQYIQIKQEYQQGDKQAQHDYYEAKLVRKQIQNYVKNFIEQQMKNELYYQLFYPHDEEIEQQDQNQPIQVIQPIDIADFVQQEKNNSKITTSNSKLKELQSELSLSRSQQKEDNLAPSVSQLLYQQKSRKIIKSEHEQLQDALELQKSIMNSQDPKLQQLLDIIPPVLDSKQSIEDLQKSFQIKVKQSQNQRTGISVTDCNLLDTEQINTTTDLSALRHQIHFLQQENFELKTRNKFLEAAVKTQEESIQNLRNELQITCQNNANEELAEQLKENLKLKDYCKNLEQNFNFYKNQVKNDVSMMKKHFIDQINNYKQLLQIQNINSEQQIEFRRSQNNIDKIQQNSTYQFEYSVQSNESDLNQKFDEIEKNKQNQLAISQLEIEKEGKNQQLDILKSQLSLLNSKQNQE